MATFLELQQELQSLTIDDSTDWASWWTKNKKAINKAYKDVFESYINTFSGAKNMSAWKVDLVLNGNIANLPNDFRALVETEDSRWVFFTFNWQVFNIWDELEFKIRYWSPNIIEFNFEPVYQIKIEYIKNISDLVNTWDTPAIPPELHDNIPDFALVEYFRQQRDWNNVSASLQYAEWKMQEKINQLW